MLLKPLLRNISQCLTFIAARLFGSARFAKQEVSPFYVPREALWKKQPPFKQPWRGDKWRGSLKMSSIKTLKANMSENEWQPWNDFLTTAAHESGNEYCPKTGHMAWGKWDCMKKNQVKNTLLLKLPWIVGCKLSRGGKLTCFGGRLSNLQTILPNFCGMKARSLLWLAGHDKEAMWSGLGMYWSWLCIALL